MNSITPSGITLLHTIAAIAAHHRQRWCIPSQETLRARMAQHAHVRRCRRTINYRLLELERAGLIHRQRRHRRTPGRGWEFRSTLYTLTRAGYRLVASLGAALRWWAALAEGRRGSSRVQRIAQCTPHKGTIEPRGAQPQGPPGAQSVSATASPTPQEEAIKRLQALKGVLQGRR